MSDYLFRGSLEDLDPEVFQLTQIEAERQVRKLILIPSESQSPIAIRESLASAFHNIYAEGYPDENTRWMTEEEILDYPARLAHFRRYSDPRYYKGVEYADIIEALARRRCAETFATNGVKSDDLYVNVQALSGGPANNAVYHALVEPGETILGMDLLHGGHLSHGSRANRSGKFYNAIHYTVDPETEQIDYDQIRTLAEENRPKFIIAGYSSYPWSVDWLRFREIADSVGAYLFADIAHVAGLVAGGVYPSPIGYADIVTFTTHKSLCGPRGACILTTDRILAKKLDKAVFPGEQGGPHVNVFVGMALAFKLAQTDQFANLQRKIVDNCAVFTERLSEHGFRIPYGGTNTHLMNLDCSSIQSNDEVTLSGDQAARILDIAGIVVNRNTIPGDQSAFDPNGIRMGTTWVTQRGFKESDMIKLADIISDLLKAITPVAIPGRRRPLRRARVDFTALEDARIRARDLALSAGMDFEPTKHGYPHFYYIDDSPTSEWEVIELRGERIRSYLNFVLSSDIEVLSPGQTQPTRIHAPRDVVDGALTCIDTHCYHLSIPSDHAAIVAAWLRDLSDGFITVDEDLLRKIPGPIIAAEVEEEPVPIPPGDPVASCKPYTVYGPQRSGEILPEFKFDEVEGELAQTPLYELHKELGAKIIPFAGWEMPVWYSSVLEEHLAVRQAAGVFDVAHMGVYQVEGPDAAIFLDSVVGNDIGSLEIGESCYTHFLNPDAEVIDDLLVYRRQSEKFLVVVNASNDKKDWAWLQAVKTGAVKVDNIRPCTRAYGRNAQLRNLRDPSAGSDMRVDIALQGPRSRDVLLALGADDETHKRIMALNRTQLCEAIVGGFDLVVSRTGYTGERMAFELFIHPEKAEALFRNLLKVGKTYGLKPIGLGARDSLRTEAGLPLYGQEMGVGSGQLGESDLGVSEAGFSSYVKTYKPWFIGRQPYLEREKSRTGVVVRFRFNNKGIRMAHNGDPVLDTRGRVVGWVTSCAVDRDGFLTGQAFLNFKSSNPGTPILIYQSAPKKPGLPPAELSINDRSTVPSPATVVNRFPKQ